MRTLRFLQLSMAACVLLFASRPLAQDSDEVVSNPDVQFNADRVKREVNYSLREAMNWERQARDLTRRNAPRGGSRRGLSRSRASTRPR